MIPVIILISLIAITLVVVWDVRRGQATLKRQLTQADVEQKTAAQLRTSKMALAAFGLVFFIAGIWLAFAPSNESPSGPKTWIIFIAYWALGKYGPAILFLGLGTGCGILLSQLIRKGK